jgi:hypothetical protein
MLVLRQRIRQPAGNGWIQPLLEQQETWPKMVALLREVAEVRESYKALIEECMLQQGERRAIAEARVKQSLGLSDGFRRVQFFDAALGAVEGDEDALGHLLHLFGFPATAAVRALVRAAAFGGEGQPEVLREVLVTTFVYGQPLAPGWLQNHLGGYPSKWTWDEEHKEAKVVLGPGAARPPWHSEAWFHDGNPRTILDYETVLWAADLHERAGSVVLEHRKWLDRWRPSDFTDLTA